MSKVQIKLLVYGIIISAIPIISIGLFSYMITSNILKVNLQKDSDNLLNQIVENVDTKVSKIEKSMDLLFTNGTIQNILATIDFERPNVDSYEAAQKINNILYSLFYKEEDIISAMFFTEKSGNYAYRGYVNNDELIRTQQWYLDTVENVGQITWNGPMNNPFNNTDTFKSFLVGRSLRDTNNIRDMAPIGVIYLGINGELFDSILEKINAFDNSDLIILDEKNKIISKTKNNVFKNFSISDIEQKKFKKEKDSFNIKIENEELIVKYISSSNKKWKVMQITSYKKYFAPINNIKLFTLVLCIICFIIVNIVAYIFSRSITNPITQLYNAMALVSRGRFDTIINIETKDEIGEICNGFNILIKKIENLFLEVIEKERQMKDIYLRSLRYQINPHFIYNTLATIALVVGNKRSSEGKEMILALSRILKNTISKVDVLITINDEIKNVKDYICIQQIWYESNLNVSYDIQDEVVFCKMPCMLVQPIVENAINHGLNRKLNKGNKAKLSLKVYREEDKILIEVFDNGLGISEERLGTIFSSGSENELKESKAHIGLKNIDQRIKLQFGEEYGLKVESTRNEYTKVTMTIPIINIEGEEKYA